MPGGRPSRLMGATCCASDDSEGTEQLRTQSPRAVGPGEEGALRWLTRRAGGMILRMDKGLILHQCADHR